MAEKKDIDLFVGKGNLRLQIPAWSEIPYQPIKDWSPDPTNGTPYLAEIRAEEKIPNSGDWYARFLVTDVWPGKRILESIWFDYNDAEDCLIGSSAEDVGEGWTLAEMRVYRVEKSVFLDTLLWKSPADGNVFITGYTWPH